MEIDDKSFLQEKWEGIPSFVPGNLTRNNDID